MNNKRPETGKKDVAQQQQHVDFSAPCCLPGVGEVVEAFPDLQHVLAGEQSLFWPSAHGLQLHLCVQQTATDTFTRARAHTRLGGKNVVHQRGSERNASFAHLKFSGYSDSAISMMLSASW